MTDAPVPTTNQPAQDVVAAVETLAKQGEAAAEAAIIAQAPAMGLVVWKQLWEAIFGWIVDLALKPLARYTGHVVIEIEEYMHLQAALSAQTALDAAKKTGDSSAIAKASQLVDQKVAAAVHYIGSIHA